MLLLINSVAHFLVDAVCIATLFGPVAESGDIVAAVVLYNTLAFSTQCVAGLITDSVGRWARLGCASMLAVVLGFLLPAQWLIKVLLIGLGNSLFHVCGGTLTLIESRGKAWKLGIFVAPGAIGVSIGTQWPQIGAFLAFALLVCALEMGAMALHRKDSPQKLKIKGAREGKLPFLAIVLLTAAVAVRAVGGSAVSFPWKQGWELSLVMTAFVFLGKSMGGFVCDRIGSAKTALWSVIPAALLIAFCSAYMLPSLVGQLLLNLTMPVTLFLLHKAMPESPGFAFGLAASALWPGTIAGQLFALTGKALWLCVILSFAFGLLAIIYSSRRLNHEKVY